MGGKFNSNGKCYEFSEILDFEPNDELRKKVQQSVLVFLPVSSRFARSVPISWLARSIRNGTRQICWNEWAVCWDWQRLDKSAALQTKDRVHKSVSPQHQPSRQIERDHGCEGVDGQ